MTSGADTQTDRHTHIPMHKLKKPDVWGQHVPGLKKALQICENFITKIMFLLKIRQTKLTKFLGYMVHVTCDYTYTCTLLYNVYVHMCKITIGLNDSITRWYYYYMIAIQKRKIWEVSKQVESMQTS